VAAHVVGVFLAGPRLGCRMMPVTGVLLAGVVLLGAGRSIAGGGWFFHAAGASDL
jgi:hypothetical protein